MAYAVSFDHAPHLIPGAAVIAAGAVPRGAALIRA